MIDEAVVEPFGLPAHALQLEAQAFCNRPAAAVLGGRTDFHTVEEKTLERVSNQSATRQGHEPLSLEMLGKPIAKRSRAVWLIDGMEASHPGHLAVIEDRRLKSVVVVGLPLCIANESLTIRNASSPIHPGEPFPQMSAIALDELKVPFSMVRPYPYELKVGRNPVLEHHRSWLVS